MVGGIIVDIVKVGDHRWWVNCLGSGSDRFTLNAIYIDPRGGTPGAPPLAIDVGDRLWWQGPYAYWTAAEQRTDVEVRPDVRVPKIGYSGVPHPDTVNHPLVGDSTGGDQ
jgi:hypothetical protein